MGVWVGSSIRFFVRMIARLVLDFGLRYIGICCSCLCSLLAFAKWSQHRFFIDQVGLVCFTQFSLIFILPLLAFRILCQLLCRTIWFWIAPVLLRSIRKIFGLLHSGSRCLKRHTVFGCKQCIQHQYTYYTVYTHIKWHQRVLVKCAYIYIWSIIYGATSYSAHAHHTTGFWFKCHGAE